MQDKNSFISKSCRTLEIHKKDIAAMLGTTLRTIDNYANDEAMIPAVSKALIRTMVKNKELENELKIQRDINNSFMTEIIKSDEIRKLVNKALKLGIKQVVEA